MTDNPTIEQLAEESYEATDYFKPLGKTMWTKAFIAGAASQSTRIEQLEEALKAIVAYKHGGYSMMEDYIALKQIAAEALNIK